MPNENLPVSNAEHRAWSYWFADGLPNLAAGLLCLFLAAAFVLFSHYNQSKSPIVLALGASGTLALFAIFIRFRQTIEWLKRRITYPRTGYAASPYFTYNQEDQPAADLIMLDLSKAEKPAIVPSAVEAARDVQDRRWRLGLTLGVYLVALLSAIFIRDEWACGAFGMTAGLGIWLSTRKNERMSWAVAVGLPFAGMYMFILSGPYLPHKIERLAFFLGAAGSVLVANGAITLTRYLKHNPAVRA